MKILTIGGGTGSYTLLKGLKNYTENLTAIVSMSDDAGSSGELRDQYGVLPPGDARRCLIALADEEKAKMLRQLFEFRFDSKLQSHNFGNLFLLALEKLTTSPVSAIKEAEKLLGVKGNVLPVTIDKTNICAELENGEIIKGQTNISYETKEKIKKLYLESEAFIYIETKKELETLKEEDKIIICPGDLYGSILPNFLVQGAGKAIKESKAKIIYICNLVTKQGTLNFKAQDFVNEIEKYLGRKLDVVICNIKKPSQQIVDKYKGENSYFVEPEINEEGRKVIMADLLVEYSSDGKIIARHNAEEIARLIMSA